MKGPALGRRGRAETVGESLTKIIEIILQSAWRQVWLVGSAKFMGDEGIICKACAGFCEQKKTLPDS